jgi:hypothetical protein
MSTAPAFVGATPTTSAAGALVTDPKALLITTV